MFDILIISLIFLNVVAVVIESVASVQKAAPWFFTVFETVSVVIFTVEYVLRVWSCTVAPRFAGPVLGRLRFMATPFAVIDLCAILPFYFAGLGLDLRFIRAFRLMRIFRIAKLGRYSTSLQLLGRVFAARKYELLVTLSVMLVLLVVASCLMYYAEGDVQPNVFSSIPASMWWGVATLTTVGYGDAFPVTVTGKLIASFMAIMGIGVFALPAGILGGGFMEEVRRARGEGIECPHCGAKIPQDL
jgi:voltage-gated potassium channel